MHPEPLSARLLTAPPPPDGAAEPRPFSEGGRGAPRPGHPCLRCFALRPLYGALPASAVRLVSLGPGDVDERENARPPNVLSTPPTLDVDEEEIKGKSDGRGAPGGDSPPVETPLCPRFVVPLAPGPGVRAALDAVARETRLARARARARALERARRRWWHRIGGRGEEGKKGAAEGEGERQRGPARDASVPRTAVKSAERRHAWADAFARRENAGKETGDGPFLPIDPPPPPPPELPPTHRSGPLASLPARFFGGADADAAKPSGERTPVAPKTSAPSPLSSPSPLRRVLSALSCLGRREIRRRRRLRLSRLASAARALSSGALAHVRQDPRVARVGHIDAVVYDDGSVFLRPLTVRWPGHGAEAGNALVQDGRQLELWGLVRCAPRNDPEAHPNRRPGPPRRPAQCPPSDESSPPPPPAPLSPSLAPNPRIAHPASQRGASSEPPHPWRCGIDATLRVPLPSTLAGREATTQAAWLLGLVGDAEEPAVDPRCVDELAAMAIRAQDE